MCRLFRKGRGARRIANGFVAAGPIGLSLWDGTQRRGRFCPNPSGRVALGSWPALGTRTRANGPGHLAPALPNDPNQSLRHASALLRQPLSAESGPQVLSKPFAAQFSPAVICHKLEAVDAEAKKNPLLFQECRHRRI